MIAIHSIDLDGIYVKSSMTIDWNTYVMIAAAMLTAGLVAFMFWINDR